MTRPPERYLIGLDLGTTGLKGVVVDRQGRTLATVEADTAFEHPREGWVEVPAKRYLDTVCGVLKRLAADAPGEIDGLAVVGATGNTVLADADGTPLTPIVNWMDQRAKQSPPAALASLAAAEVAQVVGWPCVDSFPLAHLAWLREHRSNVYHAAGHFGMDSDWLLHCLTGVWRMDHSTGTTFHLQNQVAGGWHEPFLRRLGIPPGKLSRLCNSATPIAPLSERGARMTGLSPRTTVVAGCFDHPAAARAVGVIAPGQLLLSCGTSWVGFLPHPERDELLAAGLLCDPFLSESGGPWGGMFSVPCIGRTVDWYVKHVIAPGEPRPEEVFGELAAACAAGGGGLAIDLRQPPAAPAGVSRRQVARAVMEGAARLLAEKLAAVRRHGFEYREAVMVGGPSSSAVWRDILAAHAGLRLSGGGRAAGARGAAMLAGIGVGWYRDERDALTHWRHAQ